MCVCVCMNETHVEGCSVGSGVRVVSVDAWVTFSVPEETFPEQDERKNKF